MDLKEATLENMKEYEGTVFEVALPDGGSTKVTLEEVAPIEIHTRRRMRGQQPKRPPFSLFFVIPRDVAILPQGMYDLKSETLELDGIFIVPIGQDEKMTEYEAVFA